MPSCARLLLSWRVRPDLLTFVFVFLRSTGGAGFTPGSNGQPRAGALHIRAHTEGHQHGWRVRTVIWEWISCCFTELLLLLLFTLYINVLITNAHVLIWISCRYCHRHYNSSVEGNKDVSVFFFDHFSAESLTHTSKRFCGNKCTYLQFPSCDGTYFLFLFSLFFLGECNALHLLLLNLLVPVECT